MTEQTCYQCGQNIAHKRSDAKFCSARCRMRFNRAQKKKNLVYELIELCREIPNHVVQTAGEVIAIVILNEKDGKYQRINIKTLKRLPDEELKRMVRWKKGEIKAYAITNAVKKLVGQ